MPVNDPFMQISAMAAVTEHLGFGVTSAVTYEQPYTLARKYASLDHLTNGRVGFNVVTSYLPSAAECQGLETQIEHDTRYELAEEFLDVCYKLWEGSWGRRRGRQRPREGYLRRPRQGAPDSAQG